MLLFNAHSVEDHKAILTCACALAWDYAGSLRWLSSRANIALWVLGWDKLIKLAQCAKESYKCRQLKRIAYALNWTQIRLMNRNGVRIYKSDWWTEMELGYMFQGVVHKSVCLMIMQIIWKEVKRICFVFRNWVPVICTHKSKEEKEFSLFRTQLWNVFRNVLPLCCVHFKQQTSGQTARWTGLKLWKETDVSSF